MKEPMTNADVGCTIASVSASGIILHPVFAIPRPLPHATIPHIDMTPEQQGVADANQIFYAALSARDSGAMAEVWFPADWAECVHPGSTALRGWDAMRDSWRGVFEGGAAIAVTPGDVRVRIVGDVAWVSCIERIARRRGRRDPQLACAGHQPLRASRRPMAPRRASRIAGALRAAAGCLVPELGELT